MPILTREKNASSENSFFPFLNNFWRLKRQASQVLPLLSLPPFCPGGRSPKLDRTREGRTTISPHNHPPPPKILTVNLVRGTPNFPLGLFSSPAQQFVSFAVCGRRRRTRRRSQEPVAPQHGVDPLHAGLLDHRLPDRRRRGRRGSPGRRNGRGPGHRQSVTNWFSKSSLCFLLWLRLSHGRKGG